MGKVIRKNVDIEVDDIRGRYDVEKVDDGYAFDFTIGWGFARMTGARGYFQRSGAETIAQTAHRIVAAAVRVLIAQSQREFVYVVIDNFPAYAEEMLGAHIKAGYQYHDGFTYTVRCDNHEQAEEIVDRVRSIDVIADGDDVFHPTVNNITNHALDALGGESWNATDAVTFIAAQRAENAIVHA